MIKKNIFTVIGIIISLLIAMGGWEITSRLLEKGERDILALSTQSSVSEPVFQSETDTGGNREKMQLTEEEICSVLQNTMFPGEIRPHEPMHGQLTMEEAVITGKTVLTSLYDKGIIPEEMLEYERIEASLSQFRPRGQENQPLDIYYSFWDVYFSSESKTVSLSINAATGNVWDLFIFGLISDDIEGKAIFQAFMDVSEKSSLKKYSEDEPIIFQEDGRLYIKKAGEDINLNIWFYSSFNTDNEQIKNINIILALDPDIANVLWESYSELQTTIDKVR